MNVNVKDLMITGVETITAFDMAGSYKWTLDELQSAKIANTEDKADITGKQGRKLGSLKRNKAVTVSGTSGLVSAGLMETQVGRAFSNKETRVMYPDYLTVNNNEAETSFIATGTQGNEIAEVIVKDSNGLQIKTLNQVASAETLKTGEFTYNPSNKKITFYASDIADGTEIVVYYYRTIQANVLENLPDNYSEKLELFVDFFAEDLCSNVYRAQIRIPKADFSGNFDFDFSDNQTVHAFEAESIAGACSGNKAPLWTYTVFGVDTDDYVTPKA